MHLARQPQMVLVDELAHTNVPGSEREKRYQDVEVILQVVLMSLRQYSASGESNDLVADYWRGGARTSRPIAGARMRWWWLMLPQTLQERLLEGKIYAPTKIQELQNFFPTSQLNCVAELALREVADNVEEDATFAPQRRSFVIFTSGF